MGYDSKLEYLSKSTERKTLELSNLKGVSESMSDHQILRTICMEMIKLERSIEVEREYLADKSDIEVDRVFLTVAQSLVDKPSAS